MLYAKTIFVNTNNNMQIKTAIVEKIGSELNEARREHGNVDYSMVLDKLIDFESIESQIRSLEVNEATDVLLQLPQVPLGNILVTYLMEAFALTRPWDELIDKLEANPETVKLVEAAY